MAVGAPPRERLIERALALIVEGEIATGEAAVLNRRIELTALHRDGREFPVDLSITPIRSGGSSR